MRRPPSGSRRSARSASTKLLIEQYGTFLWNALHGDLGRSFVFNQPSIDLILNRMPATLELAFVALFLSLASACRSASGRACGPNSARRDHHDRLDPRLQPAEFLAGLMLIMIFSVWLGWLPSTGRGEVGPCSGVQPSFLTARRPAASLLPALNLALFKISLVITPDPQPARGKTCRSTT